MASATLDAAVAPTDAPNTQQGGNAKKSHAAAGNWLALLRRCEEQELMRAKLRVLQEGPSA